MKTYYRIVPRGKKLINSKASYTSLDEPLPDGFIFAFSSFPQVENGLLEMPFIDAHREQFDLVKFTGSDEYDPGDVQGCAVKPCNELRRWRLSKRLKPARS